MRGLLRRIRVKQKAAVRLNGGKMTPAGMTGTQTGAGTRLSGQASAMAGAAEMQTGVPERACPAEQGAGACTAGIFPLHTAR